MPNRIEEVTKHEISAWDIPWLKDLRLQAPYTFKTQSNVSFEFGDLYGKKLFKLMFERVHKATGYDIIFWWVVHVQVLGFKINSAIYLAHNEKEEE